MRSPRIVLFAAVVFGLGGIALADGPASDTGCGKGPGGCCKAGGGCCAKDKAVAAATEAKAPAAGKPVVICEKKALAVAAKIRGESCPVKSMAILAATMPEVTCEKARSKILADVKGKGGDQEASQVILAAFRTAAAAQANAKGCGGACCGGEGKGACCGGEGGCCGAKAGAETAVKAGGESGKGCCASQAKAGAETAVKAGGGGCCGGGAARSAGPGAKADTVLSPLKARAVAAQIRSTACPDRSADILAAALPRVGCRETLAKLVREVKEKDCEVEAAEVILAAGEPAVPETAAR